MFADDVKVGRDDTVLGDNEASSPTALSSQAVNAFDYHHGGFDQFGKLGEVLRVPLGQIKFGERGRIIVLADAKPGKKHACQKNGRTQKEAIMELWNHPIY